MDFDIFFLWTLTLKIVQHVNLIHTHALNQVAYNIYFDNNKWELTKGSLLLVRGKIYTLHKTQVKLCGGVNIAA